MAAVSTAGCQHQRIIESFPCAPRALKHAAFRSNPAAIHQGQIRRRCIRVRRRPAISMTRSESHPDLPTRPPPSAGQGLAEAFERLHAALLPAVRDYLASLDGSMDYHRREDMVQEVFFRAWKNLGCFRADASPKTFVFAIAKNVWREHERCSRRQAMAHNAAREILASGPSSREAQAQYIVERQELIEAIGRAESRLSDKRRLALQLVVVSGILSEEAAKRAECSTNALYKRLRDAKKQLLGMLGDFGEA